MSSQSLNSIGGKLFFIVSFLSILLVEASLITAPYVILYFYTITILPLLLYRLVEYWKAKQQLFLLDSCYFVNFFTIVVIWVAPHSKQLLMLQYGLSHGPLLWAPLFYRNSMVLDDIDRMTSAFIHIFPPLTAFVIRWQPEETSFRWYKPFFRNPSNSTGIANNLYQINYDPDVWLWAFVAPILCYICHVTCYTLLVQVIIQPSEEYVDSFSYATKRNDFIGSSLRRFTGIRRVVMGLVGFILVGSLQYLTAPFTYCQLLTNIIAIALQQLIIIWNGATYQIDVYRRALSDANTNSNNVQSRQLCNQSNVRVGIDENHDSEDDANL